MSAGMDRLHHAFFPRAWHLGRYSHCSPGRRLRSSSTPAAVAVPAGVERELCLLQSSPKQWSAAMSDILPTAARVSDPGLRALYRQESRWQAWLDVEVALAKAQEELGIIPQVPRPPSARRHDSRSSIAIASTRASHARATLSCNLCGSCHGSLVSPTAAGCTGGPPLRTSPRPAIYWSSARRTASSSGSSAASLAPWRSWPSAAPRWLCLAERTANTRCRRPWLQGRRLDR